MTEFIAECATAHGGDLDIAADLVRAAADSGATWVKFQTYDLAKLNPADPQAAWLKQAHLDKADHELLMALCEQVGIRFLSTPFDAGSLQLLRDLGLTTFKIASSESAQPWWRTGVNGHEHWLISYPWGRPSHAPCLPQGTYTYLSAIPLYPTPLECVGRVPLLDGLSDHCEGIAACQYAIAQGARVVEAHLCLPGRSREMKWDKSPAQLRQLREFAEACETMRSGVSTTFRRRWSA